MKKSIAVWTAVAVVVNGLFNLYSLSNPSVYFISCLKALVPIISDNLEQWLSLPSVIHQRSISNNNWNTDSQEYGVLCAECGQWEWWSVMRHQHHYQHLHRCANGGSDATGASIGSIGSGALIPFDSDKLNLIWVYTCVMCCCVHWFTLHWFLWAMHSSPESNISLILIYSVNGIALYIWFIFDSKMIDIKNRFTFCSSVRLESSQSMLCLNQMSSIKNIIIRWLAQIECVCVVIVIVCRLHLSWLS